MIGAMPLLHAASGSADAVASVDLRFVIAAAACGGFAFGGLVGCAMARRPIGVRIGSPQFQRFAAAFVLLFAVLPNVAAWEHVLQSGGTDSGAEVHAAHCHESAGTCSEMPVLSGPGQLLFSDPLLTEPVLGERLLPARDVILVGRFSNPDVPPPRAA